jgi:WbqC-like protein
MTTVVISQPMLFAWVGLFEQIRLADTYVHYVDVPFSKGSFTNRVQVKTAAGVRWLTVPLEHQGLGTQIRETQVSYRGAWQRKHLATLKQAYARAKFCGDMIALVEAVYSHRDETIAELAIRSLESVCAYYGLDRGKRFLRSPDLGVGSSGSARVLEIVQRLQGGVYVTGHGAGNYLEHEAFEQNGVEVRYMNYRKTPYPQMHGEFTPYVTILDLIANVGPAGGDVLTSGSVPWREFLK